MKDGVRGDGLPFESLAMMVDESLCLRSVFLYYPRKHIEKLEKPNGNHHCSSSLLTDYQQTAASKAGLKHYFLFISSGLEYPNIQIYFIRFGFEVKMFRQLPIIETIADAVDELTDVHDAQRPSTNPGACEQRHARARHHKADLLPAELRAHDRSRLR